MLIAPKEALLKTPEFHLWLKNHQTLYGVGNLAIAPGFDMIRIGNNMNKQQLAAKIWESANQMRSKIEANEYKDYILGFIFYKYLSDQLVQFVTKEGHDT